MTLHLLLIHSVVPKQEKSRKRRSAATGGSRGAHPVEEHRCRPAGSFDLPVPLEHGGNLSSLEQGAAEGASGVQERGRKLASVAARLGTKGPDH